VRYFVNQAPAELQFSIRVFQRQRSERYEMKIRQSSRQLVVKVLWHTAVSDRSIVFAAWRQSELPSNTGMPGIRASLFSKCSSIDRFRRFGRAHWCVYQECTQRQTTERARSLAIGRICSMYAMRCGLKTTAMIFNEQV